MILIGRFMIIKNRKKVSFSYKGSTKLISLYKGENLISEFGFLDSISKSAIRTSYGDTIGNQIISATETYFTGIDTTRAKAAASVLNASEQNAVMAKYIADYGNSFASMICDLGVSKFDMPVLAIDANDENEERSWLIRSSYGYTNWNVLDNVMSQTDWAYVTGGVTPTSNYVSKVGNTSYGTGTLVKFFVPTVMPTGWSEWFADNIDVRVNGTQILSSGTYHNNRKDVTYDFSNIIELNKPNHIIIKWYGSGNHGVDFGLRY